MRFKNIINFLVTIMSTLKRFLNGRDVISSFEVIENRLKICRSCENKYGDELKNMICKMCECKIRYKVRFETSTCPQDKWNSVDS